VSSVTAEDVVKLFESDERSRKRLAKLLLPEVVSEPDLRLAIINAVLRDVATKEDITKVMEEIEKIRKDVYTYITELRERVSKLEGVIHTAS